MSIKIKSLESSEESAWDAYVYAHSKSTLYHLSGWRKVIEKTYGHNTYYLLAIKNELKHRNHSPTKSSEPIIHKSQIIGILPLVHLKHILFGNSLISMPFFDLGGLLADDEETKKRLLSKAIRLGQKLKVNSIELRQIERFSPSSLEKLEGSSKKKEINGTECSFYNRSHKVRMLLNLPESSEVLMKSFKAKLRSQIKKPIKEGLYTRIGGTELLRDFYRVFSINMRDLGSPVHSKRLMHNILLEFPERANIAVVYKDNQPLACSMIVGFKGFLENPWASALRNYAKLSPNMLLYWAMLKYACDNGFDHFDFGRSTPNEGTYKFKKQWGAKPMPLEWYYFLVNGGGLNDNSGEEKRFSKAVRYWQKLPVLITKIIGPRVRKNIGL